jgi:predicted O-linked N-acetylglucosamine transferase (SPINDLY family)
MVEFVEKIFHGNSNRLSSAELLASLFSSALHFSSHAFVMIRCLKCLNLHYCQCLHCLVVAASRFFFSKKHAAISLNRSIS